MLFLRALGPLYLRVGFELKARRKPPRHFSPLRVMQRRNDFSKILVVKERLFTQNPVYETAFYVNIYDVLL